jgi:hypothetical protein
VSYTPINTDATNVAGYTIARLNATSPTSSAATSDQAVAIADSYLGAFGIQGALSDANGLGTATTASATFVDVGNGSTTGFSSWTTPSIQIARTYLIHASFTAYMTVAGGNNNAFFQLLVDGSAPSGQPTGTARIAWATTLDPKQIYFAVPVSLSAGTHAVKLQWKVNNVAMTIGVDVVQGRTFWITG